MIVIILRPFLVIEMSTLVKYLLGILGFGAVLIAVVIGLVWVVGFAFTPPSQKDAISLISNFIGFKIGKDCIVKDWNARRVPDLIVTCRVVLSDKQYKELLSYCESKVGYKDPRKTDPVKRNEEEYIFADNRPEDMKSLTVRVSRNKPEITLKWLEY